MTLNAGAAVREINPPRGAALFGYPRAERMSTGVHDPLLASALFLEHGSRSALLIALDLLFLDPPTARSIRRAVAREADGRYWRALDVDALEAVFAELARLEAAPLEQQKVTVRRTLADSLAAAALVLFAAYLGLSGLVLRRPWR